jgi:hypothetical protein
MSPEVAVERVRTFLKWCADRFEWLGPGHVPLDNPLGYRRNGEFWVPATFLTTTGTAKLPHALFATRDF